MTSDNLQGFNALPLKLSSDSSISHTIYFKEHSVRGHSEDKPSGRTLFVLNIPPFIEEADLKYVFGDNGTIISIEFTDKPTSSNKAKNDSTIFFPHKNKTSIKVAYIVYKKVSDLNKALQIKQFKPLSSNPNRSNFGVVKWIKHYNTSIPNTKIMKAEIETYMEKYDKKSKDKFDDEKALEEADDEGWITVTKHGRRPGFERKESVANKIIAKEKVRQNKKELKNFYTFQIRESKMKHIINLRQKFEEDKKKIAILKESRKFRPF